MDLFRHLRQHYHPIQPTVRQSSDDVVYRELAPDPALQSLIYCYWELKTIRPLQTAFLYRVVADGCMDIFLEVNSTNQTYVMGFASGYTEFPLPLQFHYVGIRFMPTAFPHLFDVNASELTNRCEHLQDVAPQAAAYLQHHIHTDLSTEAIQTILDQFFLSTLRGKTIDPDVRLYRAMNLILQKGGNVSVESDLDTGLSARQLRRLFHFYVGDSAKTFSKVVRFQKILQAKPSTGSLQHNKAFFEAGYYDQAHFIKEFKAFYGDTPNKSL
jgi:hypothetical protein